MRVLAVLLVAMMLAALVPNVAGRRWGWAALDVFVAVWWLGFLLGRLPI